MIRLIQYPSRSHHKNDESMERMCKSVEMEFEKTDDRNRLRQTDYTYLWLPCEFVSPDDIPEHVYILYGPNFFVFPNGSWLDGPRHEKWSKRCIFTCLSDWVHTLYYDFVKESVIPIFPLPLGIDKLIQSNNEKKTIDCIIYFKLRDPILLEKVVTYIQSFQITYKIFEYGSYSNHDYIQSLQQCSFCIWIGRHESQGFALQECLMMNKPILLLDCNSMFDEMGKDKIPFYQHLEGQKKLLGSATSLWSNDCGEICSIDTFNQKIMILLENIKKDIYHPREFILSELSDEVCMKRIIDKFNIL